MKRKVLLALIIIGTMLLISCSLKVCPAYKDVGPYGKNISKTYKK